MTASLHDAITKRFERQREQVTAKAQARQQAAEQRKARLARLRADDPELFGMLPSAIRNLVDSTEGSGGDDAS